MDRGDYRFGNDARCPGTRAVACLRRALAVSILLGFATSQARAQTAVAGGSPSHIDVSIPITASVAGRCSFAAGTAPGGNYVNADIKAGFTHDFSFALQCNGPSRVAVQSASGGLLASVGALGSGYTNLAPYQITLVLVGDSGVSSVSGVCDAQTLNAVATSPCTFRGPVSTTQGLELAGPSSSAAGSYLRVSAPPYAGTASLMASPSYLDTVTVTVSAAI